MAENLNEHVLDVIQEKPDRQEQRGDYKYLFVEVNAAEIVLLGAIRLADESF